MKVFDNVTEIVRDDMEKTITRGSKVSVAAACFSMYAYKSEKIEGCTVHTYNDGDLIACFDENIPESVIKEIAKRKPLRAVFHDSGFASSPEKINVFEIFKLYMPENANDIDKRMRVI